MARTIPCPACRKKVSAQAPACLKCGHPLTTDAKFQKRAKSRRSPMALVLVLLVTWAGLAMMATPQLSTSRPVTPGNVPSQPQPQPSAKVAEEQGDSSMAKPNVASDVLFSILDSRVVPGIKRSLDIRLIKKVSEQDLIQIATELKAQDPRDYQRTFMCYFLPGMSVGSGAWATTHFNPTLEVQVLGLTVIEEQALAPQSEPAKLDYIGRWIDERPLVAGRISIFRQGGTLFLERLLKDNSAYKEEVVETKTPLGRRFDMVVKSRYGDHWVLGSDGVLQMRDSEGLIALAKPIK